MGNSKGVTDGICRLCGAHKTLGEEMQVFYVDGFRLGRGGRMESPEANIDEDKEIWVGGS